ncbi:MAG TPA: uracil-DNA glycosylase family protein [Rhizobium sp.]|nr:uracil-DNA glycosylase family protein [Rhizobium sp.]
MTRIMIVGEAFGQAEAEVGQPFVGPSGHLLNSLLRKVGIDRDKCVVTNAFNLRPPGNDVETLLTKEQSLAAPGWPTYAPKTWVHRDYALHLQNLDLLRRDVNPHLIVALGDTALWALTHQRGIARYRGTPLPSHDGLHKVFPTYHPAAVLRKFALKPVVQMDFHKAAREAAFAEIRRPQRFVWLDPSLEDIETFYNQHIVPAPFIAVDTETKAGQITEVGIATSPVDALVIPFWARSARDGNYWPSPKHELAAWKWVKRILAEKPTVGQNFQYDMTYLYETVNIHCPRFIGDTMLMQHALEPELEKSLGFLGSIYTDEPAWKFMREGVGTLKKED